MIARPPWPPGSLRLRKPAERGFSRRAKGEGQDQLGRVKHPICKDCPSSATQARIMAPCLFSNRPWFPEMRRWQHTNTSLPPNSLALVLLAQPIDALSKSNWTCSTTSLARACKIPKSLVVRRCRENAAKAKCVLNIGGDLPTRPPDGICAMSANALTAA